MWDSSLNSETLTSKGHIVINVSNCLDLLLFDSLWMDLGARIYIYEPNLSFFPRNEWRNICLKTYQNISFAYNIVLTGKCLIAVDKITTLTTLEKFEDEIDKIKTLEIKMIIIPNLKRVQFEL